MKFRTIALAALLVSPVALHAQEFDVKASAERGKPLYMQTCIACHQPTGMGLPGAFPPVAGTEYATGSVRRFAAILLKGLQGPITVKNITYNNVMNAVDMQFPMYKDDSKVADVINFVRTSFGNTATEHATPEIVKEVREKFASRTTPWTEAEIKEWKD